MNIRLFKEARERIAPYIIETPLIQSLEFPGLYLKCENFQWTCSYKPRGAVNAALQKIQPGVGIVARSSGNFAQGIAYAGNRLGFPVAVVMPEHAPALKVKKTEALGAEVFLHGTTHAEGDEKVAELVCEKERIMIHAFDDPDVIAGQGSVALEVCDQLKKPHFFFGPIGGGGIMAGCSCVIKQISQHTKVIGVEPEGAARLTASLEKGERLHLPSTKTIADGLLSPSVGKHNWPLLKKYIDSTVKVSEQEIIEAMKILFNVFGLVAEPSGAVSFAGFLKKRPLSGSVVCVITGGNVDRQKFLEWLHG
ncbi:Threo-3-hydroxyaspartate ammonia-lyase [Waddlia chondrophila 2032/99]|uniref:Threonine dehydratase n=2 Tax=Waddlia chondrophila TaxID=71667 RepID=D6YRX0_WADCW|nr:threonine/serine dehydratase [Waddlia chondrophila]ADI38815.1 Threonine dehydratase [Waddlia chondrophila WSU 86-1044]CCB91001.1 Threo-3-hydroxyaspartate ammonia-lyase [Waddlia chondrophila 2032/99]